MFTGTYIQNLVDDKGEVIVTLESDAYPEVELHKHDTIVRSTTEGVDEICLSLSDGNFCFTVDRIESVAWHQQSTDDLGL